MNFPTHLMKDTATFNNGTQTIGSGGVVSRSYATGGTSLVCRIQADESSEAMEWMRDTGKNRYTVFLGSPAISGFTVTKDCQITFGSDTLRVIGWLFGPPQQAAGVIAAILCLGLFEGAYVAEIVRGGIRSLPRGQWEAGQALGLSRLKLFRLVILPQAVARVVPPLAGQGISLVKDSSIISLVSIQDLSFLGAEVAATTNRVFETWLLVALFYFIICAVLSAAAARLERRFAQRTS